jgi:hypothetical protein
MGPRGTGRGGSMTITLTQTDATAPPVTVAVTGIPVVDAQAAGAITGIVQRSTDGVRYTTVRGMIDMEPDGSGVLDTVSDYEFRPGVLNTYRAGLMQEVAAVFAGSAASAWANASTGQVWNGANAAFNEAGGYGTILHTAQNTEFLQKLAALTDMGDMDMSVTFKSNVADTAASDNFSRVTVNGFGSATIGGAYTIGTVAADFDTNGSVGTIQPSSLANDYVALLVTNTVDTDMTATFSLSALIATNDFQFGLVPRQLDGANRYIGRVHVSSAGAVTAVLHKRIAGAQTDITSVATGITLVAGTSYSMRVQMKGSLFRMKFWATAGSEPTPWTTSTTDASLTTGNNAGFFARNNSATTTQILTVDNLLISGGVIGGTATVSLLAHRISTTDGYRADVIFDTDDSMSVAIKALNSGVTTTLGTFALSNLYTLNTQVFRARLKIDGPRIRFKVWEPNAAPQPDWQHDAIVSAGLRVSGGAPGLGSVRSSTNNNTSLTFSFTDLTIDTGIATYLQTQTITPDLAGFWLCSTMRSFLNLAPRVVGFEEPSRSMRGGSTPIAARTLPIAQSELSGAREWKLTIRVPTLAAARQLEYACASGDVFYLQTPADCPIPRGYYRIVKMDSSRVLRDGTPRMFELPLEECAAPGPDVATASATWDSVIALWGTWPAVVAAEATWEDLLEIIGDPSEVIVE